MRSSANTSEVEGTSRDFNSAQYRNNDRYRIRNPRSKYENILYKKLNN